MAGVKPSAIRELLRLGADPKVISFGGGYPDPALFPLDQLKEVFHEAILAQGQRSLQYTESIGLPRLREQIAARMATHGVACHKEHVLILQGGQQGLDLVAKMLVNPGDTIITENPTFLGALIAFNPYEPHYLAVPMDDNGLDVEALEIMLAQHAGVKFIYVIPDFQNPTGVTLSLERRKKIVELANQYNLYILEDSPYREVRFSGASLPPIKSFDREGRVIYLGSFSKILAPGLRVGWVVAHEDIIQQLNLLKLAADTQCSTLNMTAVSLYLEKYSIDQHIERIQSAYRHKKTLMLDAIREYFPENVKFTDPDGGLFTWLSFPEGFDAASFMLQHALPAANTAYVPGATFFPVTQQHQHARFSYSTNSDDNIIRGIRALGGLLKKQF